MSRAGTLKNRSRTSTLVPGARRPAGAGAPASPPLDRQRTRPRGIAAVRLDQPQPAHRADRRQRLAAEAQRGDPDQLLVGELGGGVALEGQRQLVRPPCRSRRRRPGSARSRRPPAPPRSGAAPASIAFSTSSLTTDAGRSTTSPAAMRLATSSGRRRMAGMAPQSPCGSPTMLTRELARKQPGRDPLQVRQVHRLDQAVAAVQIVVAQIVQQHAEQRLGDLVVAGQAQRERAGEVGPRVGEVVLVELAALPSGPAPGARSRSTALPAGCWWRRRPATAAPGRARRGRNRPSKRGHASRAPPRAGARRNRRRPGCSWRCRRRSSRGRGGRAQHGRT